MIQDKSATLLNTAPLQGFKKDYRNIALAYWFLNKYKMRI